MTDQEAPRTEAGRAAWAKADGLGPKIDTLTVTAREWRETILAIEREVAAAMTAGEAPRTEPTTGSDNVERGSTTWTFRGPVEIMPDPQSGAVHITFAGAAAPPEPPRPDHRPVKRIRNREFEERCVVDGEFWPCDFVIHEGQRSAAPSGQPLDVDWTRPCDNCGHPYCQHTGRSIQPPDREKLPGSRIGPIAPRWGSSCEALAYPRSNREDWHHTCPCSSYRLTDSSVAPPGEER